MQRTFNYTNRRKIEQKDALFSFAEGTGDIPEFNVHFGLDTSLYPVDAALYVEAYYKETRQRFDYGRVSRITPPINRKLDRLDLSGPIMFRVIIVDESGKHGLLLASGEGFRADADKNEDNKSSILTVVTRPLGQLTWTVEFQTGGMPELCLNNNIPNAIEKMRVDPVFQALILPAALKQVLTYFLWNNDDDADSCQYWMAFAKLFAETKPDSDDPSELLSWVDEVVEGFSSRFELCDRLANASREDEE